MSIISNYQVRDVHVEDFRPMSQKKYMRYNKKKIRREMEEETEEEIKEEEMEEEIKEEIDEGIEEEIKQEEMEEEIKEVIDEEIKEEKKKEKKDNFGCSLNRKLYVGRSWILRYFLEWTFCDIDNNPPCCICQSHIGKTLIRNGPINASCWKYRERCKRNACAQCRLCGEIFDCNSTNKYSLTEAYRHIMLVHDLDYKDNLAKYIIQMLKDRRNVCMNGQDFNKYLNQFRKWFIEAEIMFDSLMIDKETNQYKTLKPEKSNIIICGFNYNQYRKMEYYLIGEKRFYFYNYKLPKMEVLSIDEIKRIFQMQYLYDKIDARDNDAESDDMNMVICERMLADSLEKDLMKFYDTSYYKKNN